MPVEQLIYNALVSSFQNDLFYVVPGALVASMIYWIRS